MLHVSVGNLDLFRDAIEDAQLLVQWQVGQLLHPGVPVLARPAGVGPWRPARRDYGSLVHFVGTDLMLREEHCDVVYGPALLD